MRPNAAGTPTASAIVRPACTATASRGGLADGVRTAAMPRRIGPLNRAERRRSSKSASTANPSSIAGRAGRAASSSASSLAARSIRPGSAASP